MLVEEGYAMFGIFMKMMLVSCWEDKLDTMHSSIFMIIFYIILFYYTRYYAKSFAA